MHMNDLSLMICRNIVLFGFLTHTAATTSLLYTLQAYYPFDNTADDMSGNGHNGTLNGTVSYGPPKVGTAALMLNGTGCITIPGAVVKTNESFSVAAWVKIFKFKTTDTSQTFVSIDGTQISAFYVQLRGDNNLFSFSQYLTDQNTFTGAGATATAITVSPNVWYHLVAVSDTSLKQVQFYVSGELQSTTTFAGGFLASHDTIIGRGLNSGQPADWVVGQIDEVYLYTGVLTSDKIKELAAIP
ncbi:unnamed protein product [Didymodactylos carnosus]|uniref:LamG-like jellyroll fold domain-containing protein n=1 Tax=Didymodactylos carnosus TaxID=1234261 RepID=A0A8S2H5X1_9BILA|nr:unnamed protein product [Didymodactylos carnosus]CAF3582648.1 unnamed protein product [Didymodactylos carnosus]